MALAKGRNGQRFSANIWPGFVDAMTALLMVLMFVLTIFMIVQFTLRETIDTQGDELAALNEQVAGLADALGLERARSVELEGEVSGLSADIAAAQAAADRQTALLSTLTAKLEGQGAELTAAQAKVTAFETQVASLLAERNAARTKAEAMTAERDTARGAAEALIAERDELKSAQEALNLAVAAARAEVDEKAEAARLAAARRYALEALVNDLRAKQEAAAEQLSEAEATRLTEAAAAAALREKLKGAEDELTAMTLALEEQRRRAEETLTLLAAARAEREAAAGQAEETLSEADRQKALLATANAALAEERAASAEAARKVALLNQQILALRSQLGGLQNLLDASAARDADAKVQIEALGTRLNSALAQVASEQRRRAELEEAERKRLEAEAAALKEETKELARYRSEFFARLSQVLAGREGVRVVGDRFVFSAEVLFEPGSADLAAEGRSQIANVATTLQELAVAIPSEIDWVIRVDGHTDNLPLSGFGRFRDNWELSQGRALSVVRFLQGQLGFPPERLVAAGFGEYHPVAEGDTPEARAQNRRIELKLTER
ncbi:peptidoglycan -binding protein [Defluviimonas salinarum]|uniref:Peptidoglycan -binding protein n=1 Tax=Defluviimonas salinarum TaxID=2992147 RepID=A0ABT3J4W5_9RHOB|nr:peptidoglycan -binding protein [Defluviimonas salinarum]MCW3782696.1 peptidoglycan -binding protein [Defluviimonas salinarum]